MSAALAIVLASICLAGGGLLGFLLGRGGGSNKKRAEALEQEFEDYKRDVTAHFGKTAEHFQSIGRQYRELYEHMASGATSLCEEDDRARLAFPSLLTIEAVAEDPDGSEAGAALDAAAADAEPAPPAEAKAASDGDDTRDKPPEDTSTTASGDAESSDAVEASDEAQASEEPGAETTADTADADTAAGEDADDAPEDGTDRRAASDASDDALEVEVSVEVVDDDETGTEGAAIGAKPRAETPDLDPIDDAGATRH